MSIVSVQSKNKKHTQYMEKSLAQMNEGWKKIHRKHRRDPSIDLYTHKKIKKKQQQFAG